METFIYVIASDAGGPVKIGLSTNPSRRVRQLQTGFPGRLTLHHTKAFPSENVRLFEQIIHKAISYKRMEGEWFDLTVEEAIGEVEFAMIRYGDETNLRFHLRK